MNITYNKPNFCAMFMVRIASDIGFHYMAITHMIERKSYGVEANIINIFEFSIRPIFLYLVRCVKGALIL